MKQFSYSIEVPKNLGLYLKPIVSKFIRTLTDPRSWKGYKFEYSESFSKNHIRIIFTTNDYIKKTCGFTGLSCADVTNKIVYINENNWRNPPKASGLSLQEYRTYLILHEIGHVLGKKHPIKCDKVGSKMNVMTQQTLGKCTKVNTKNVWPFH